MGPDVSSTLESDTVTGTGRALQPASRYVRFGPFQVDQQRQEVTKYGSRLRLQGKVYHVLLALIEKQGDVVTREELRFRLWPAEANVNYDANVNTTVNKLRQALNDSSDKPSYIETIPKKGYCLIAPVEFADVPLPVDAKRAAAIDSLVKKEAILPERPKSNVWITLAVIGLILAGMLLGAGITRLWITHFAPGPW